MSKAPKKRRFEAFTDEQLTKLVARHGSIRKTSEAIGCRYEVLRNEMRKRGLKSPAAQNLAAPIDPQAALSAPKDSLRPAFPDSQLVKDAGLDPTLWEVGSIGVSETESETGSVHATRTSFRRRKLPVSKAKRLNPGTPKPISKKAKAETWMILTDHHCPHHDPDLHAISCQMMREIKPAGVLILGDIMDLSAGVSRHPAKANSPDPQANLDAAFGVLCDIRDALPESSRVVLMEGNHDVRIENYLLNNASPVARLLTPDGRVALSLRVLLGLDELGIELVTTDDGETYPHATWEVIEDTLVAIHGTRARKGGGASARATAIDRGHGVIMGHVHRLAHNVITTYTTKGDPVYTHAVEAGYMGIIKGGLGYSPQESTDWQAGFTIMDVVEGEPHFEQCLWNGEFLYARGKVYRPNKKGARKAA